MRNPNEIAFQTRHTSTAFIEMYGYNSGSSLFAHDYIVLRETYGNEQVTTEHRNGRNWIVVTQPVLSTSN
jgi:hypothetical protein